MRAVFRNWRGLLLTAVIFALLGGLYRGTTLMRRMHSQDGADTAAVSTTESASEDGTETIADSAEDAVKQKQKYIQNSLLMQIDPQKEGQATATIRVRFADQTGDDTVFEPLPGYNSVTGAAQSSRKVVETLGYYTDYIAKGMDLTALAKQMDTTSEYLREIIYVENTDTSLGTTQLRVIYKNQKGAAKIRDYILDQIESIDHADVTGYGDYTLDITDRYLATVVDANTQAWLNNKLTDLNNLNTSLTTYNSNSTDADSTEEVSISGSAVAKQTVLFAVAGFIGGAILYVLLYYMHIVAATIVLSAKELNSRYEIRSLAVIPQKEPSSLHGLDRVVFEKQADQYSSRSVSTCYQIAAQNLIESAGKASKIALFGDIAADDLRRVRDAVAAQLQKESGMEDYDIDVLTDLNNDPASLRKLAECDAVVAVARAGSSEYRRIDEMVSTVLSYKKEIFGSIMA